MDRTDIVERLAAFALALVADLGRRLAWRVIGAFVRLSLLSKGMVSAIVLYALARGTAAIGLMGIARGMTSLAGDLLAVVFAAAFMRACWRHLRTTKVLP